MLISAIRKLASYLRASDMRLPVPSNLQTLARVATIAGHDVGSQPLSRSECHPFVVPLTANGGLVSDRL